MGDNPATLALSFDALEDNEISLNPSKETWGILVPLTSNIPSVELNGTEVVMGRQSACDVRFTERLVSGRHCKIYREPNAAGEMLTFIHDFSTNGTFIDGNKVGTGKSQVLLNGCTISLLPPKKSDEAEATTIKYIFHDSTRKKEVIHEGVEEIYDVRETLGNGNFASVKLAVNKKTGKKFALKVIDKKKYIKNAASRKDALMDEVNILKKISHPNIIGIHEVFDNEKTLYIVLELVTGGEIFDCIVENGGLSEEKVKPLMRQLLEAVHYLHQNGIVHRDLKPENILFATKAREQVKISDFGLSRVVGEGSQLQTMCGTPQYLAPEVISNTEHKGYSKKVDVWSLGGILFFMLAGYPPFDDSKAVTLFEQVKSGSIDWNSKIWDTISESAKDLIKCMLEVNPQVRYDCLQALDHPWISEKDYDTFIQEREKIREEKKQELLRKQKELEDLKKLEEQKKKDEEDERIRKEVEARTKEIADKLKQENEELELQKKRKRDEYELEQKKIKMMKLQEKENEKPMCQYGAKCYRKNPQHKNEFRHPSDDHGSEDGDDSN